MIQVPLGHAKFAIIDDCDLELILCHNWNAVGPEGRQYAAATIKGKKVYLHRMIAKRMGLDLDKETDHEDRNRFNCQRSNLREATRVQNVVNSFLTTNTSGYRGVSWQKDKQKFLAKIKIGKEFRHLGYFDNPFDASEAYNRAASAEHKEFAPLR